jgi:ribosomal protein S18 acetylase RimI-like enzyme
MEGLKHQHFGIVPIAEEHIAGFHAAVDSVARERLYLAMLAAPSLEKSADFVRGNIRNGNSQFVALAGGRVVGWCDIVPMERATLAHAGLLGMGVIEGYRGCGIGTALMRATLEKAKKTGLSRIELTVREGNRQAIELYKRVGFVAEGLKRNAWRVEGKDSNVILMALLF